MRWNRLFILITAVLLIWALARFCHYQTAGFQICKIQNNFSPTKCFEFHPLESFDAFNQKFFYLGRGKQSFAFVSQDQKYVLKLFNNGPQRTIAFLRYLPFCDEKKEKLLDLLKKTFQSYEIAFQELKEETGLISLHLSPTFHLQKKVTLVDKLGIEHCIDLDKTGFLLQKKATLVYPKLLEFKREEDLTSAQKAIEDLLDLLILKCTKGISDSDPLIRTNFGFIGNKAVQIDVGPFARDPQVVKLENYKDEMIRITTSLKIWINSNYPELSSYIETQLAERLN
jgi:hypothetical protein